jgi:hypothetical protein
MESRMRGNVHVRFGGQATETDCSTDQHRALPSTLLTPLDLVGANHLFRLVSAAYETRSLVVTSNWPFEQWTNFPPHVTIRRQPLSASTQCRS